MDSATRVVLRNLLRQVQRNVTRVSDNRQWRDYLISQIRTPALDPITSKERLTLAEDIAFLIKNIATHKVTPSCMQPGSI